MACLSDAGLLTSSFGLEGRSATKPKTGASYEYVHGKRSPVRVLAWTQAAARLR